METDNWDFHALDLMTIPPKDVRAQNWKRWWLIPSHSSWAAKQDQRFPEIRIRRLIEKTRQFEEINVFWKHGYCQQIEQTQFWRLNQRWKAYHKESIPKFVTTFFRKLFLMYTSDIELMMIKVMTKMIIAVEIRSIWRRKWCIQSSLLCIFVFLHFF